MTVTTGIDPFDQTTSGSAVSFKDARIGDTVTGTVTKAPEMTQSRDYETGEPAFWPSKGAGAPEPKMSAVIGLDVHGEAKSLWVNKPSALWAAVQEARQAAGSPIGVGGMMSVQFVGEQPNTKNPRLNPQKLYKVTYTAPTAPTAPDAFNTFGTHAAAGDAAAIAELAATQPTPVDKATKLRLAGMSEEEIASILGS